MGVCPFVTVGETLCELVLAWDDELDCDGDADTEGEQPWLVVDDDDGVSAWLPVAVALAVGEAEGVPLPLAVTLGLAEPLWLREAVPEAVFVGVAVCVGEGDAGTLAVPETEGEQEDDAVCEESWVPARDGVAVAVAVASWLPDRDGDDVTDWLAELDWLGEPVCDAEGEALPDGEPVTERDREPVDVSVCENDGDDDALGDAEGLGEGDALVVALLLGEAVCDDVLLGL